MKKINKGFTVLELTVVMAIIATASLVAVPTAKNWMVRNSLENAVAEFYSKLSETRISSFNLNTTTRIQTTKAGNNYTLSIYSLPTATNNCDASAVGWSLVNSRVVTLDGNFNIAGSGIGNICFYRDGSSSGGAFSFTEVNSPAIYNMSANIDVVIATGFIDVVKDN